MPPSQPMGEHMPDSTTPATLTDTIPDDDAAIDQAVGRRVREFRTLRGLTQTDLATRIGVAFQQLQKYETGKNRISASRLVRMAHALDVPVATLFGIPGAASNVDDGRRENRRVMHLCALFRRLTDDGQRSILTITETVVAATDRDPCTRLAGE